MPATAQFQRIRASATYLVATHSVLWAKASASTQYSNLRSQAALDMTLVFRKILDSVSIVEALTKDLATTAADAVTVVDVADVLLQLFREYADSVSTSDASSLSVALAKADSATASDAAPLFVYEAAYEETLSAVEAAALALSKELSDAAAPAESSAQTYSMAVQDTPGVTDSPAKALSTPYSEAVTPSDSPALGVYKVPSTDSVTPSDTVAKTPGLGPTDAVTTSDVYSRVVTWARTFSETVAIDDTSDVEEWFLNKTNVVSPNDSAAWVMSTSRSDTATPSDTLNSLSTDKALSDTISEPDTAALSLSKPPASETVTVTDNVTMFLTSGASSVLNSGLLNDPYLNQ